MTVDTAHSPWADLVFHVLAHLPSDVPASLFEPRYLAFVEQALGPAPRGLLDDLGTLAGIAVGPRRYATLQELAWLFETPEEVARIVGRDLAELDGADVKHPALLARLLAVGPEVEVLRSLAELEAERHARLPPSRPDRARLRTELERARSAAPALEHCRIRCLRPLVLRGRVRGSDIWVGAAGTEPGPTPAHAAWQAAHEATVGELRALVSGAIDDDRPLEQAALVLLRERAARAGLGEPHARWLAHLSRLPALERDGLGEPFGPHVARLLDAFG